MPRVKLVRQKKLKKVKSKKKLKNKSLSTSPVRGPHACKACVDLLIMNVKVAPLKFSHDLEKLKYFTKLYSSYASAGKIINAEQCISKIKANHPILFRLQHSTVSYLVKNSQILFKLAQEKVYKYGSKVDQAVLILLYGRCKMKFDRK